uniref:Protein kinase domain-containing protein n=1 Tax=Plectus sambesii TaxID=2011161 RepID=A0A914X468_9BILA
MSGRGVADQRQYVHLLMSVVKYFTKEKPPLKAFSMKYAEELFETLLCYLLDALKCVEHHKTASEYKQLCTQTQSLMNILDPLKQVQGGNVNSADVEKIARNIKHQFELLQAEPIPQPAQQKRSELAKTRPVLESGSGQHSKAALPQQPEVKKGTGQLSGNGKRSELSQETSGPPSGGHFIELLAYFVKYFTNEEPVSRDTSVENAEKMFETILSYLLDALKSFEHHKGTSEYQQLCIQTQSLVNILDPLKQLQGGHVNSADARKIARNIKRHFELLQAKPIPQPAKQTPLASLPKERLLLLNSALHGQKALPQRPEMAKSAGHLFRDEKYYGPSQATDHSMRSACQADKRYGENALDPGAASNTPSLSTTNLMDFKKPSPSATKPSAQTRIEINGCSPINHVKKEKLGQGAFGVVHKCFDTDAHKFFVAKETIMQTEDMIKTAENEIDRLKDMNHPRIIGYYGFKKEESTIVIFMEYMAAGSLLQIIKDFGPIKEPASIKYIEQILNGLAYIHKIGIIHCDLKCDNILNDGQGNIKLGDFGIAMQKRINTANHSYFSQEVKGGGTCHWLAPEVMNGEGCSRRSDIWSLGCTIVEMLTGKPPYSKMAPNMFNGAMYNKSLSFHPNELVPRSSDKIKAFLSHLLQFEINKRPYSAVEALKIFGNTF